MEPSINDVIGQWLQAKQTAAQWVEHERKLREYIVKRMFMDVDGTQTKDIGNGYALKVIRSTRWKVTDDDHFRRAAWLCSQMAPYVDVPAKLFKWKPELAVKVWKDQPAAVQELFHASLTATPNASQLSLESPNP